MQDTCLLQVTALKYLPTGLTFHWCISVQTKSFNKGPEKVTVIVDMQGRH